MFSGSELKPETKEYTNPVSSFYVYYISTPNFRLQIQKILFCRDHVHYVVYYQVKTVTASQSTFGNIQPSILL